MAKIFQICKGFHLWNSRKIQGFQEFLKFFILAFLLCQLALSTYVDSWKIMDIVVFHLITCDKDVADALLFLPWLWYAVDCSNFWLKVCLCQCDGFVAVWLCFRNRKTLPVTNNHCLNVMVHGWLCFRQIYKSGFDNYHKITVCNHVCVPKFWHTWCTWANTKKHISVVIPFT